MKWITAVELEGWASRISTRVIFPELMRDLITASAKDISEIRFPGGDKGQVRGFDGWLEAAGAPPYVPSGISIWEFGVSGNPAGKFASDYDKRVAEIDAEKRKSMTFVFASPRTWDNPKIKLQDFVNSYKNRSDFKDVSYLDGSQLEDWLLKSSAIGARYARDVLGRMPQLGARSTDEFWDEYTKRFRPQITEEVVLCAREVEANQIITHLVGKPGALLFLADGLDEVSALAVSAIRKSDPKIREFLEARTLVIDTEEAGRDLAIQDRYGFIISPSITKVAGLLSSVGPTVSSLGFTTSNQNHARLTRSSTRDMAQALVTMGLTEDNASKLASKSGRSLTILERHIPAAGYAAPAWTNEGHKLVPALLAGGWDSRHEGDQTILAELAGARSYLEYEASIRPYLNRFDSPLDREGGLWKLRAPVDALVHLSGLIGDEHLDQLASICSKIFRAQSPDIGEERFGVSKAPFSSLLRDGVANTLLMFAALHSEIGLTFGRDPQMFVDTIINELPGLNSDARVILSLERQLPALMEAASDPLLSALERLLEGGTTTIAPIFVERNEFGFHHSRLPSLLNALEVAAWNPGDLMRVSLILARLTEIDPGGSSRNRPLSTLQDTFVAWKPETNAPLAARLAVLDVIVETAPTTGWNLLVGLLPKSYGHKSPNLQPRFREAGASQREKLTVSIVAATYDAITDRVLAMLGTDLSRWLAILSSFPLFSPDRRVQFLDSLEHFVRQLRDDQRLTLRREARALAERHKRFRDAKWALPDADLQRLTDVVVHLESSSPSDQALALFDEISPLSFTDFSAMELQIAESRKNAIKRLIESGGIDGVIQLSEQVRVPQLLAAVTVQASSDNPFLFELIDRSQLEGSGKTFAIALAGAMRSKFGEKFDQELLVAAQMRGWTDQRVAMLLLGWPETRETWALVDSLGNDARTYFWERRQPYRFEGSSEELATLINHYLAAKRPGAALAIIHLREGDISWNLLEQVLALRVGEINGSGRFDTMDGYYIEELFKHLRKRDDVPKSDLARWEFAYFPALEDRGEALTLFGLMASDPEFYMSILKAVFLEDGVDPDTVEVNEKERQLASSAYRILTAFDHAPGEVDGVVNGRVLDDWVRGVIMAATRERRLAIVYGYIGRALAHSAEKDGCWPQAPVASIIEKFQSKQIESGISIERYNMRGVHSKNLFEGGGQERDLANKYRTWSSMLPPTFLRTKAMLESIAKNWDSEGIQSDDAAARDKLRFE